MVEWNGRPVQAESIDLTAPIQGILRIVLAPNGARLSAGDARRPGLPWHGRIGAFAGITLVSRDVPDRNGVGGRLFEIRHSPGHL